MQRIVPYSSTLDNVVGYGFRPTDEELVDHYLKRKLQGDDVRVDVMPEIDLCDVEPWEVPVMLEKSVIRFNGPKWFFLSRVDHKYRNSKRFNRKTKCGYWKITGKERKVMNTNTKTVIGTKKTLVYYEGCFPDGVKSNWVIHEYHDATFQENQKLEKTDERGTDALICDEEEPRRGGVSDYANQDGASTEIGTTFQEVHLAENCFSPIQQSPTGIQPEEASSPNSPLCNAYFKNENNVMQTPFETMQTPFETRQDDMFVMQTPFETRQDDMFVMQTPSETRHDDMFVMHTPSETMQDDMFVMQTPSETMQDDIFVMQTPSETMQDDMLVMQIPFETMQDDILVMQIPSETMQHDKFVMQTPFETIADDEFLNSYIANEDSAIYGEIMYAFVNSSTQSELLRRVCYESSETNAEVISKPDGNIMDTSTIFIEYPCSDYPNSDDYRASKKFKSSHNVVHDEACLLSSNHEASQEENESIFQDVFSGGETSSCDSTPNKPLEINCIEISSSPSTSRRLENQYHPRPNNNL